MPLSTIRKLTEEDETRLAAMLGRFASRHGMTPDDVEYICDRTATKVAYCPSLSREVYPEERRRLGRLYLAAFRRAVRHASADSTGWGYLGWSLP